MPLAQLCYNFGTCFGAVPAHSGPPAVVTAITALRYGAVSERACFRIAWCRSQSLGEVACLIPARPSWDEVGRDAPVKDLAYLGRIVITSPPQRLARLGRVLGTWPGRPGRPGFKPQHHPRLTAFPLFESAASQAYADIRYHQDLDGACARRFWSPGFI